MVATSTVAEDQTNAPQILVSDRL